MAKIERVNNAARNIFFGVILRAYQIIVPFLMRTAMIYLMGAQYLGLNSLFTSVLQVLNLAELGVGSAMVYSMYKPIADDDETTICALMKLYRTYYRVIGLVIAVVGCALTPFIPYLIKSDVPVGINIYILYLLNLGATVLSYWLFAYKNSILQAHQRTDVVSKVTLMTSTVQYGLQIVVLWVFHNYYLYVIIALATQALTNIVTAICANKLYPQFKPKGNVDKVQVKRINQRIRDLFTSKIGSIIYDSADTIVISA
ncbi:MAG: polysaccharide biosynthesis protein, partial [Bariatricus sp.]|nr:polysaccharide biosynthesis protein [Bariatricus sp.]